MEGIDYSLFASAGIALLVWFIQSANNRRYNEQKEINSQVLTNTFNIGENKTRDEANQKAFDTYKETINGEFQKNGTLLKEIHDSVEKLSEKIAASIEQQNEKLMKFAIEIGKK